MMAHKDPDRKAEYAAEYRRTHRAEHAAYVREWHRAHPGYYKNQMLKRAGLVDNTRAAVLMSVRGV